MDFTVQRKACLSAVFYGGYKVKTQVTKIIAFAALSAIVFSISSCGNKAETVAEHNRKLVSGEIDPDVKKVKKDKKNDDSSEKKEEEIESSDTVTINIPEEELAELVDKSDNEYKSFETVDMPSANFFMGKKLNAVATLSNHEMTMLKKGAVTMEINNTNLTFDYTTNEGAQQKSVFVYKISPEILKTAEGRDYTYIAYGTEPLAAGEINGTIGIIRTVKMKDSVDMGENAADTYILYEETSQSGSYYLMTVE